MVVEFYCSAGWSALTGCVIMEADKRRRGESAKTYV